jgi:putative DNA primase/helicase
MWRRIKLIPFSRTFAPNPTLGAELEREAPGILRWALDGCQAWQREGGLLRHPDSVIAATSAYAAEQDSLTDFLAARCVLTASASARAGELYEDYRKWAEGGLPERERLSSRRFGEKCKTRFQERRTNTGTQYMGVGLRAKQDVIQYGEI